jgi:hypothetical protein
VMMKGSPGSKRFHKQQPGFMDPLVVHPCIRKYA